MESENTNEKRGRGRPRKPDTNNGSTENHNVENPEVGDIIREQMGNNSNPPAEEIPQHIDIPASAQDESAPPPPPAPDPLASYDPLSDDPLLDPVKEDGRAYAKGGGGTNQPAGKYEDIPEAKIETPPGADKKVDPTLDSTGKPKTEVKNPAAADMSGAQKRREAEKAAKTIMFHYCKHVPTPFKKWASFNERKIETLAMEDKLNLNLQFKGIDKTFTALEYIKDHNKQIDGVFNVDEETKQEITEPLIDVLMEQDLILTPTQRLLIAVGSHIGTMGFKAWQISQQNKTFLATVMMTYEELKRQNNSGNNGNQNNSGNPGNSNTPPPNENPPQGPTGGGDNSNPDDYTETKAETVTEDENGVSMDDAINTESKTPPVPDVEDAVIISETKDPDKVAPQETGMRRRGRPKNNAVTVDEIIDSGGNIKETGE